MKTLILVIGLAVFASAFPLEEDHDVDDTMPEVIALGRFKDALHHATDVVKHKMHQLADKLKNETEHIHEKVAKALEKVKERVDQMKKLIQKHLKVECANSTCTVCTEIEKGTLVCVEGTFDAQKETVTADVKYGGVVIVDETFQVRKPKPLCLKLKQFHGLEFCAELYDLRLRDTKNVHGCMKFEAKIDNVEVSTIDLKCIDFSL